MFSFLHLHFIEQEFVGFDQSDNNNTKNKGDENELNGCFTIVVNIDYDMMTIKISDKECDCHGDTSAEAE